MFIQVFDHKTVEVDEEVNITLSPDLYNQMLYFYKEVRPRCRVPVVTDKVFFSRTGEALSTNNFSKIVRKEYQHVGCQKKVTCTNLRKMGSTAVIISHNRCCSVDIVVSLPFLLIVHTPVC